jgi:cytochrome b
MVPTARQRLLDTCLFTMTDPAPPPPPLAHTAAPTHTVRVWDLPTRLFHWTLAAALVGSVVSAKIGGNAMVWHFRFGYVVFALLLFRVLWGLVGGRWSRFVSFLYAPATLLRYLRGQTKPSEWLDVGHNPLGALSVFALLLVLAAQVATGLVADDEIANIGPLNRFVSLDTGVSATGWHSEWGQWLILGLVALHVAAIAFYTWRGHGLIGAMVDGDKTLPADTPTSRDTTASRLMALAWLAACAAAVAWVVNLGG